MRNVDGLVKQEREKLDVQKTHNKNKNKTRSKPVTKCGQSVTGVVSSVYNVNFRILSAHLKFSVVVPAIFLVKVA